VNGQRTEIMTPFAPWSSEWGMNPANSLGYTYGLYRSGLAGHVFRISQVGSGGAVLSVPTDPSRETPAAVPLAPGPAAEGKPDAIQAQPGGNGTLRLTPAAPGSAAPAAGGFFATPAAPGANPFSPGNRTPPIALPPAAETAPGEGFPGAMSPFILRPGQPFDGGLGPAGGAPLVITALNDSTFVVAHPTVGPGGEPAVMLTVYRLQGSQLRVVSTALHRLGPGAGPRRSEGYFPVAPSPRQNRLDGIEKSPDALPTPSAPVAAPAPRSGQSAPGAGAPAAP
jgi:hypothetical protein